MKKNEIIEKLKGLHENAYKMSTSEIVRLADVLVGGVSNIETELVSEDFEKEIQQYIQQKKLSDVSFIVPSIARHFANWQKLQMIAKAVEVTLAKPYQNSEGGYTQLVDSKEALPFGDNIKVLVIKED